MKRKNFIRKKEDFECLKCGRQVIGDGYTDHCPGCLWGKHVDREIPGDRVSDCGGLLEPVGASYEKGEFRVYYKCEKCSHKFVVKEGKNDDRECLMGLVAGKDRKYCGDDII